VFFFFIKCARLPGYLLVLLFPLTRHTCIDSSALIPRHFFAAFEVSSHFPYRCGILVALSEALRFFPFVTSEDTSP